MNGKGDSQRPCLTTDAAMTRRWADAIPKGSVLRLRYMEAFGANLTIYRLESMRHSYHWIDRFGATVLEGECNGSMADAKVAAISEMMSTDRCQVLST